MPQSRLNAAADFNRSELSDTPPVIVLGSGIAALGLIRQFGRQGISVYVTSGEPRYVRASRWFNPIEGAPSSTASPERIASWLEGLDVDRAVLVPCSDEWTLTLASLPETLNSGFAVSLPPRRTVQTLVDKGLFSDHLRRERIPHPETILVKEASDLARVDNSLFERAFLKPTNSQRFYQTFEAKAFHVEDRNDAERRIVEVLDRGLGVLIQEMVPGPVENQLCVDGFVDRHGRIRGRFARRWLRKYPDDFGESSLAVSVDPEEIPEAIDLADRTIGSLPYRGVFSVELKWHEREQRYQVLEVNARPWWYVGFTCTAGVDVCTMLYLDALGRRVPEVTEYEVGKYVAYPYYDWNAVRQLPPNARPGYMRLFSIWTRATQPVFALDDPAPGIQAFLSRQAGRLSRAASALGDSLSGSSGS